MEVEIVLSQKVTVARLRARIEFLEGELGEYENCVESLQAEAALRVDHGKKVRELLIELRNEKARAEGWERKMDAERSDLEAELRKLQDVAVHSI